MGRRSRSRSKSLEANTPTKTGIRDKLEENKIHVRQATRLRNARNKSKKHRNKRGKKKKHKKSHAIDNSQKKRI